MDRRLNPSSAKSSSPILSRPAETTASNNSITGSSFGGGGAGSCHRSASTSPNSNRRTMSGIGSSCSPTGPPPAQSTVSNTINSISGLTLSPLLGNTLMGGPRVTARRSWSPQHQSSLEVPTPRQTQSARNSLAATGCSVRQQNSIEV